jgi:TonB family protein
MPDGIRRLLLPIMLVFVGGVIGLVLAAVAFPAGAGRAAPGVAYRCCVVPPRPVHRVEPDLTGLAAVEGTAILEVHIDEAGRVTKIRLLRGIRADADSRVLAAVEAWRFEPPALSTAVDTAAGRVEAGTAVPVIVSIAVPVSHAAREGFES